MSLNNKVIGFVGGGAMAEAIIKGMTSAGIVNASQIIVSDILIERTQYLKNLYKVNTCLNIDNAVKAADIVILAVKPQTMAKIYEPLKQFLKADALLISIVAGVKVRTIEEQVSGISVVRVMPNTPVAVVEGMSAIALGQLVSKKQAGQAEAIFSATGKTCTVDEVQLDAVTGLSGCGPGYGFVLIDALADVGVLAGLSRQMSVMLAAQTLLGAAKMVLETGEHPAKLRDMVTSPGGITIQSIRILEQRAVRAALIDAVAKTTELSWKMGKIHE